MRSSGRVLEIMDAMRTRLMSKHLVDLPLLRAARLRPKGSPVPDQTSDPPTREHIERLVKEEQRLLAQQTLADSDRLRLMEIHVALDRCWDVLRRRRALRERLQSPGQPRFQRPDMSARDD